MQTKTSKWTMLAMAVLCCISGLLAACEVEEEKVEEPTQTGSSSLKVSPGSLTFDASGETKSLTVTTTHKYFGIETSDDWLSFEFDDTHDIIYLTAAANTTGKSRKTSVAIFGSDDGETEDERITVKVEQEANSSKDKQTQKVSASGGTVNMGSLQLAFPSGTFDKTTEVSVVEVNSGQILGNDEASPFYEVTMPIHTGKPFKVSIASNDQSSDIVVVAHMPACSVHSFEIGHNDLFYEPVYKNGAYEIELPQFENPNDETASFAVGLAHAKELASGARTRVGAGSGGQVKNVKWHYAMPKSKEIDNYEVLELIDEYMTSSVTRLMNVNFVKDSKKTYDITVKFEDRKEGDFGEYKDCLFGHTFGGIYINSKLFTGTIDKDNLFQTIIHELHHYFSDEYDNRWLKAGAGKCSQWIALTEAGGVWAEKLTGISTPSPILIGACPEFILGFDVEELISAGIYDSQMESSVWYNPTTWYWTGDRRGNAWREHGYGMALLFEYLSNNYGDQIITEIYKKQAEGGKNYIDCIKKVMAEKDPFFFDNKVFGYKYFLVDAALGIVKNGIFYPHFSDKTIKSQADGESKYPTVDCFPFGMRYKVYGIATNYKNSSGQHSVEGKQVVIEEKRDGVTTEVYLVSPSGTKGVYNKVSVGEVVKDKPLVITDTDVLNKIMENSNGSNNTRLLLCTYVTTNDTKRTSEITVTLKDSDVSMKLSTDKLEFGAAGGTQEITVTTNQPNITGSISDKSWLTVTRSGNKLKFTATANTTYNDRYNTVIIRARDADGNVKAEDKITVRQLPMERKDYNGYFVNFWQSKDQKNSLNLSNDGSFTKKFAGSATVEGEYTLVSYDVKEGDGQWDKTWTCTIIDPEGKTVTFRGGWSHSMYSGDSSYIIYEGVEMVGGEWWM